jgi:2-hydroxy-3-keto-5-methylthiopentenyl-1-phosphate phosphatase
MRMAKQVAVVCDWDKTLSPRYMPHVLFDKYGVDERAFWAEANDPSKGYINPEISFMAHLTHYTKPGMPMEGLKRKDLPLLGSTIEVYPGVAKLFQALKDIGVEIYIVSAGLRELLAEHPVAKMATQVWASSYVDEDLSWPSEVITPIEKVRALYEISKGCDIYGIHPTAEVPDDLRRIPFKNIIYVGDGPSDAFAFNKVSKSGGNAVGVWDPNVPAGFDQIERMRTSGLLNFTGRAYFDPQTSSTGFWIYNKCLHLQAQGEAEAHQDELAVIQKLKNERPTFVHPWSQRRMS